MYLTLRHAFGVEGYIRDNVAFVTVPDPDADGGGLLLGYLIHPVGQQVCACGICDGVPVPPHIMSFVEDLVLKREICVDRCFPAKQHHISPAFSLRKKRTTRHHSPPVCITEGQKGATT